MDGDEKGTSLGIEVFAHVLLRRWRLIALVTVVGLLASAAYLALAPREYTASTTVNLTVISTEPFAGRSAPSSLLDEQEEKAIAQSFVVASRAAEDQRLGMSAREIRRASTVSTSSGAAVVTVNFTANSAERAAAGADAVAGAYLSFRQERAAERITQLVEGLDGRIEELTEQIVEIDGELDRLDADSSSRAQLASEREQRETELTNFLGQRNGLQGVDTAPGVVLSAAADSSVDVAPSARLTLLTGLAAALVLGVLMAFIRDLRDRRLRSAEELSRVFGAPVLSEMGEADGSIPALDADADALRVARERVLVSLGAGATVLVVDASHEDQVSALPLNLAVLTAQSGTDVQLITPEEPNRTRSRLDDVFGPDRDDVEMSSSGGSLTFFGATDGHVGSQADPLLTAQTTRAIHEAGERTITFVVLTMEAYRGSILSALRHTSAVILLGRERVTTREEIRWLRDEADAMGAAVLGAIFTHPRRSSSRHVRGQKSRPRRAESVGRRRPRSQRAASAPTSIAG